MAYKILIVEDEAVTSLDLEYQLSNWGYTVLGPLSRGEEALELVERETPDLALMDIHLAGELDGVAVADQLRSRWDVPVVYLTAFANDQVLERAKLTMPLGYIVKPYTEVELRATLEMALVKLESDRKARTRESLLQSSEKQFRQLVDSSPVGMLVADADERILMVNAQFERDSGYGRSELAGQPLEKILPEQNVGPGKSAGEKVVRRKDGGEFPAEVGVASVQTDAQKLTVISVANVSERKKAELIIQEHNNTLEREIAERTRDLQLANARLLASENFAIGTLDALSSAIVILDEKGVIISTNRAAIELAESRGIGAEEFCVGVNYLDVFMASQHAPPSAGELTRGIREVISGKRNVFDLEYAWDFGKKPQWFILRVSRFPGRDPVRVVVSNLDNTQLRTLQEQQNRSQRMESLGTMAGGIAHDLNNALAPILLGMEMLGKDNPAHSKMIDTMRASGQRAASMVRQLLTFAKGTAGLRAPLRMKDLILEVNKIIGSTFPKDIQLVVHTAKESPVVVGDSTQLHQVLLNLCVNARDAMPKGGKIEIREDVREVDELFAASIDAHANPGKYAVVTITDTGTGISPEVMERLFEPFFTTKGPSKGTGLGLATVRGIIKSHQGFIHVETKVGEGTSFSVYIPAAEKENSIETQIIQKPRGLTRGKGEVILLVDDEPPIREIGSAIMKRLNYNPVTASDGVEGLMMVAEHRKALRVIITDLAMPVMSGIQFVRAVRHSFPDIPIIVASGSVNETTKTELSQLKINGVLNKPFTEQALAEILSGVLSMPQQ